MKQKFLFFIKYAFLWSVFFVVTRGLFLLFQYEQTHGLSINEIATIFLYGLKMDFSATGYIMLIPGLILCATPYLSMRLFIYVIHGYTFLLASFLSLITVVDFELFTHWGFRFDLTPLKYLGSETASSSSLFTILFLIFIFTIILVFVLLLYFYLTKPQYAQMQNGKWFHTPVFLVLTTLLIVPIRGGFDVSPMNLGTVFFHKKNPFANQAAINLFWSFGDSIAKKN